MSEIKKDIPYKVQKGNRPKIEEVISFCLDGELREAALGFAAWLRENSLKITLHSSTTRGHNVKIDGEYLCLMLFYGEHDWNHVGKHYPGDPPYWSVSPVLLRWAEYEEIIVSEGWQGIFWDNMRYCNNCLSLERCTGAVSKTFFGRDLEGLCKPSTPARTTIRNPDEAMLSAIKRLILLEKTARKK